MNKDDSGDGNKQADIADLLAEDFEKKHPPSSKEKLPKKNDDKEDETLPYEFTVEKSPIKDGSFEVGSLLRNDSDTPDDEYYPSDEEDVPEIIVEDELTAIMSKEDREKFAKGELNFGEEIKEESELSYEGSSLDSIRSVRSKEDFIVKPDEYGDVLEKICATKRNHIDRQKALIMENKLHEKIYSMPAPRGFISAINSKVASGGDALIAEIKKASPSKGVIRDDFEPGMLAKSYTAGGATCISVLTDNPYFQGRDEYIDTVKRATDLPVLRKDFILDSYQVVESRALGADCILLIMAALTDEEAVSLEKQAISLGMDVLVEVHNEEELERALQLQTMLIGINNRDLKTLKIDLATTERLVNMVPSPRTVVCESGIYSNDDILRMNKARVRAFLVGESLMSQNDVTEATIKLLGK